MNLRQLRRGELAALTGAALVIAAMFLPSYEGPAGSPDAWHTYGAAVTLVLVSTCVGLAMVIAALTERTSALPIATAVFCVPVGIAGVIAAIVRLLERPDHASSLGAGSWLAFAGTLAILAGAMEVLRDERTALYEPARPDPRAHP